MMTTAVALLATSLPLAATAAQATTGDETLSRLRAAHLARPDDPMVSMELGLRLYQQDNASPEARHLLETAATRFPKRRDVQLALLDSYLAGGDSAGAAALLGRLEPELDADERFALDTTYCLLGRGRLDEARARWSRVAQRVQESLQSASRKTLTPSADRELKRRVAEVLFVQGLLTARLGTKDEALQLLRQADGYGFPPLDSPLMMVAADCLYELQEYALATQAYREVVAHAPANTEARLRLGGALYASGKLDDAREEFETVLGRDPDYPQANYSLGAVLLEQKRTDEAKAHLERELAHDKGCFRCMAKLGYLAYLKGDDRGGESWLRKAAALAPDDLETLLVSGMLENRTGRYDLAIRHLTRVVEQSPSSIRGQYQLALAYQRSGNAEKAREHRGIYDKLIREQKARTIGVRGTKE
jgi:tetratricopeptide (TPR) repeat protein